MQGGSQTVGHLGMQQKGKPDDAWKQDPCIQAIVAKRMQQIEKDVRAETA